MPRQARLDAPGVLHHIMIRGIERRNIFRNDRDGNNFIDRLASLLPSTMTFCYAWAFMPNHAHFLFRSGPSGIAHVMRKLLTGYAVSFNHRYHRTGQLFQNRYKSIICQEDTYLAELVRYIHLNPLRARVISTIEELDRYPYSGHSALMGIKARPWQDTAYVLRLFGDDRRQYRFYIEAALNQGRRPDLTGGGLIRSLGRWKEAARERHRVKGDERILGETDFVLKVIAEAAEQYEKRLSAKNRGYTLETLAEKVAQIYNISPEKVLSKGRHAPRVEARSLLCYLAVRNLSTSVTDLARSLGMAPSAISYAVTRGGKIAEEKNIQLTENERY